MLFGHPFWASFFFWVELIPLTYCSWSSGFSWYLLPSSLDSSSLESLSGYKYVQKNEIGSYDHLMSSCSDWYDLLLITTSHFTRWLFTNVPAMVKKLVFSPSTCLCSTMVHGIFYILTANSFTLIPGLPIPPPPPLEENRWCQYELSVAF